MRLLPLAVGLVATVMLMLRSAIQLSSHNSSMNSRLFERLWYAVSLEPMKSEERLPSLGDEEGLQRTGLFTGGSYSIFTLGTFCKFSRLISHCHCHASSPHRGDSGTLCRHGVMLPVMLSNLLSN
ncbi:hypothetical protein N7G274_008278 [Stereocaulon virgatum]|uniref:Secreted protein n=1 Tax=Stereocaulon virgatum TaxID=373712 RepID=A0ABR3ZZX1_9LECA